VELGTELTAKIWQVDGNHLIGHVVDEDGDVKFTVYASFGDPGDDIMQASEAEDPVHDKGGTGGVVFKDLVKANGEIKYNWSPKLINQFKNLKGIKISTIRDGDGVKAMLEEESNVE
ncbi:MAG: hypothetical protein GY858_06350, partial [Candidatus Omnitrophica bacterium]|nr:hypothetical protein [Candidatus Omnitrophota bacterium]